MCDACDQFSAHSYVKWLHQCDKLVGQSARCDLQNYFSFLSAYRSGVLPAQAIAAAIQTMEAEIRELVS